MTKLKRTISKGKIGYRNEDYKLIIPCQYDEGVEFFGDVNSYQCKCKYGLVVSKGCCGMIDVEGNVVVPIVYEDVQYLFDDLFAVRKSTGIGTWQIGVININGDVVVPFEYKAVVAIGHFIKCWKIASSTRSTSTGFLGYDDVIYNYSYFEGLVWYNKFGVEINPGEVKEGIGNLLIVEENNKLGVINELGEKILCNEYDEIKCICDDLFIVRIDGEEVNKYGVISKCGEIIPIEYAYIEHGGFRFFKCYTAGSIECKYLKSSEYLRELQQKVTPMWFNTEGKNIYVGKAWPLNEYLLSVERNNKLGVLTYQGERLLNFIYDYVVSVQGKIGVAKDGFIGLLENDGTIIINPSYRSIECVSMDSGVYRRCDSNARYGQYSEEHPFSTQHLDKYIDRIELKIGSYYSFQDPRLIITASDRFNCKKYFILRAESYEEIFSIEEGVVERSRYDQISQLTEVFFAVRRGCVWGVFRVDSKELVVPCDYNQVYYECGNVVLLQKDGLWGAKSLETYSSDASDSVYVDIPIKYLEIKQLDKSSAQYFGVKRLVKQNDDSDLEAYTIVDPHGVELPIMKDFDLITTQFVFYRSDRVLCSISNKYGFISLDGYVAIPFKYDEVRESSSGLFAVRVGDAWGDLSLDRGEIIPVKYGGFFTNHSYDTCAYDAITKRMGILNPDGTERIPSIYEYLEPVGDYYLFAVGARFYGGDINGYDDVDWDNCGCLDKNGNVIIPPKYKRIEAEGKYIFARRQEPMLVNWEDDCWWENSLVYDLYNSSGDLLIGGFSKYEYYSEQKIFKLFYGGKWKIKRDEVPDWLECEDVDETKYFDESGGRWLVVTDKLRSVKRDDAGNNYFKKEGTIIDVMPSKADRTKYFIFNCRLDVLFYHEPIVYDKYIIYSNGDKFKAIRITDGVETIPYEELIYIGRNRFFAKVDGKVGVIDFEGNEILPIKYVALTYPVENYFFGIIETSPGKCKVVLYDFNSISVTEYVAAEEEDINRVYHALEWGHFMIKLHNGQSGLKSIISYCKNIFDESFQNSINDYQEKIKGNKEPDCYWFEGNWNLIYEGSDDNIDFDNHTDYLRDSWEAMTDGMCGDMDDGFDGDYSFLGRG